MKKLFLILSLVFVAGCGFLASDDNSEVNARNAQLYTVYDKFKAKYDDLKVYTAKNSFDTVGQKDFAAVEKNLNFVSTLLNDGIACAKADFDYDELGYYFPWYKSMNPISSGGLVLTDAGTLDEFCYSNLSGSTLYSYKGQNEGKTRYSFYGTWENGVGKEYYLALLEQDAECKLGEWSDDIFDFACTYQKDNKTVEERYRYDLFFETGALREVCEGEGEQKVCNSATL